MKKFVSGLIVKAGKELLKEFYRFDRGEARFKSKHQVVTKVDLLSEKIILSAIRRQYPSHQILSEESGLTKTESDYLWIVDPLDGTTNFVLKSPLFGINLALLYKKEIVLAAVYLPFLDKLFFAEKGKGTTMNGKKVRVSQKSELLGSFLTYCHGSGIQSVKRSIEIYKNLKIKYSDMRQLGSSAVEMTWVAAGFTDGHFVPGGSPWDVAAGALIVREAGGKVTDFAGHDWTPKSKDVAVSNSKIHQRFLKEINKYDI